MKHILIVDDMTTNLKCASEILKDAYEITTANSGRQALSFLTERIPDLILLDINMQDMNGYEVMKIMEENSVKKEIPIIFLMADTNQESEAKGLDMGAFDFIRKPFEPEVMRSRVDKAIRMSEHNAELKNIAQKDGLTELLNRRCIENLLNQKENSKQKGYFLLLDMDNFKQVNDSFGHIVGDDVLVRFSRVLEEEVKAEDCVSRIGGDEFAIYISGEHNEAEIRDIASRIIAGVEFEVNNLLPEACDFKVSVSIGISKKPEDGNDFTSLYSGADKALYYVKQNGKRGYHFFGGANDSGQSLAEENSKINLLQLQRLIQEKEEASGAYKVEYDGFKRIYHFVARCIERKNQDIQLVLFTISHGAGGTVDKATAEETMLVLEKAISGSLRRGDVATKCGNVQYVAILMDASYENGNMVAGRILSKFKELLPKDTNIELAYEMQSIKKNGKSL